MAGSWPRARRQRWACVAGGVGLLACGGEASEPSLALQLGDLEGHDPASLARASCEELSSEGGFSLLGSITPEPAAYVAHALLRDNIVFAITSSSVAAYELAAIPGPPIRQVELPTGPF
jgi:hypothetical protein